MGQTLWGVDFLQKEADFLQKEADFLQKEADFFQREADFLQNGIDFLQREADFFTEVSQHFIKGRPLTFFQFSTCTKSKPFTTNNRFTTHYTHSE